VTATRLASLLRTSSRTSGSCAGQTASTTTTFRTHVMTVRTLREVTRAMLHHIALTPDPAYRARRAVILAS
jgi:hypothetical protein